MIQRWFRFRPANALVDYWRGSPKTEIYSAGQWAAAWQWFVQRLASDTRVRGYHGDGCKPYEWLNDTSSINNSGPDPLCRDKYGPNVRDNAKARLHDLLQHAGDGNSKSAFLRRCGIPTWRSLDRPIVIPVQTSDDFPRDEWFDLFGRTFKESPNSCHRKAKWVQRSSLELSHDGKLWALKLTYGYRHDGSSWYERIRQKAGERLDVFAARVDAELADALTPDENRERDYKERKFGEVHRALETLFYDRNLSRPFWETPLAELITGIDGSSLVDSRIELTSRRLGTLRRWTRETMQAAKARSAPAAQKGGPR